MMLSTHLTRNAQLKAAPDQSTAILAHPTHALLYCI
jgi:hypothetical protein